jgi:actin-related protein 8
MDVDIKNLDPSRTNAVSEVPMEVVDVANESKPPSQTQQPSVTPQTQSGPAAANFPGGFPIDVCFEASKLPMDVAIFNSARAAGGDEKIRKYLQAVLVIGGTALIPGMAHALESR